MRIKGHKRRFNLCKLCLIVTCVILLFITIGYSAFSTNTKINVSGTINSTLNSVLKENVVSSGDGLYLDIYNKNRYVFKGANPSNYIKLGDDMYRIVSIEPDGYLKVFKSSSVGVMPFDEDNNRNVESEYCDKAYGCKIWSSKSTTLDLYGNQLTSAEREVNGTLYLLPEEEATLNVYLNNVFYNGLSENVKSLIVSHAYNIGVLDYYETDFNNTLKQNEAYKWNGKIGLLDATDYIIANSNTDCNSMYSSTYDANLYSVCKTTNYINRVTSPKMAWLISPFSTDGSEDSERHVMYINPNGAIGSFGAGYTTTHDVFPCFYLKLIKHFSGTGTEDNPYVLIG